jgi:hypothetical protein
VSADGGVCLTGTFGTPTISGKYPANGTAVAASYGTNYDSAPLGAFGGMGIIQLMAPPGPTQASDGTNTILDDNILLYRNSVLAAGADKQGLIAWRGFPDAAGVFRDDAGNAINIGANEGELRPAPILLPVPFSAKTRMRSFWLDTGASKRRPLASSDNLPRGIIETSNFRAGPTYEFAGLIRNISGTVAGPDHGYVAYDPIGESVRISYPTVVDATQVVRIETGIRYLDEDAYSFELAQPALGADIDRYSQYEAELLNAQNLPIGAVRILTHTDRVITASAENGALPTGIASLRVRAKFFQIMTNGTEGLGPTETIGGTTTPIANVKIGFAFHQDPSNSAAQRYPSDPTQFEYDLGSTSVQEAIRVLGMSYVQWDILFDISFNQTRVGGVPIFGPSSPRPELHFLRIPFRF